MSDVADLVAVLGGLDREVAHLAGDERATAQRRIGALVPPYDVPAAVGWYDEFLAASGSDAPTPDLDQAIRNLARPTDDRTVAARRLAAIGAAARAFPERYGPSGERRDVTLTALTGPGILASGPRCGGQPVNDDDDRQARLADEAEQCLAALADTRLASFGALRAANRTRVQADLPRRLPRCSDRLVDTTVDGDRDPTPALAVTVCVGGLTLDEARDTFLDPANWERSSGWCEMVAGPPDPSLGAGGRRFLEVVGTGCDPGDFQFRVWLDFSPLVPFGGSLVLTYVMSPPEVQRDLVVDGAGANQILAIDEGSLVVADEGAHLRVTSTKRLRYATQAIGRAVLILACAAGFADMGARFIEQASGGVAQAEECQ